MDGLGILLGVLVGAALVLTVLLLRRRSHEEVARRLLEQARAGKVEDLGVVIEQIKAAFGALSREALSANADDFLKLAGTKFGEQAKHGEAALDAKKKLIDQNIEQIGKTLDKLSTALQTLDKDRRQAHGELTNKLKTTTEATADLRQTTSQLREALASTQRRGQWGERMAEDVLRLVGFQEGINYRKQSATETGSKPDFTFLLPRGRCVNMDVKFPLDNYLKFVDAPDGDRAGEQYKSQFLRDVRNRIKEVTNRDYIDPTSGTLDYVLVFIPNEQVYGFIHENDASLLDDALKQKVVLCSPLTLYAVLAVIRQAAENFRLEETSREILALLGSFKKEWGNYTEVLDRMGSRLEDAMKQYEALSTTRTRKLEKQLEKIEDLRSQQQDSLPADVSE